MCGIAGVYHLREGEQTSRDSLEAMGEAILHRGPDAFRVFQKGAANLVFTRLSIIDLANGDQPFHYRDSGVHCICNGEIYNYKELRKELKAKGYQFQTSCDVEVLIPMYLQYGLDMFSHLNGQFAIAIYDERKKQLVLARDQFGICPLFYANKEGKLHFGSEIKAILACKALRPEVDLTGLDQILTFPGNANATTMFKNIAALAPGHFMVVKDGGLNTHKYWDINYPEKTPLNEGTCIPIEEHVEAVEEALLRSVKYRLNSDVPLGFYLSGGLDSSLIGAMMRAQSGSKELSSFSITFPDLNQAEINESRHQRVMAEHIGSDHHELPFSFETIEQSIEKVVFHAETPLKETYNVCSLALSTFLREHGYKVTLCGEGADELFGGYHGYKFDRNAFGQSFNDLSESFEQEISLKLWGNESLIYEKREHEFMSTKQVVYSNRLMDSFNDFDATERFVLDNQQIENRDIFHQRSYLDLKLRLAGHLIADHGDRMTYASSIEGRYPFLDVNLVDYVRRIHPEQHLHGFTEKYILKKVAEKYLPDAIINRQKFGFVAPGGKFLIDQKSELVNDYLSYNHIKESGFFNPDTVEQLKQQYQRDDFQLAIPYETDLLIIILTFEILKDRFGMASL